MPQSADIVSVSWLFPVHGAEFLLCKGYRQRSARLCAVLCSFCGVLFPAVGAVFMHLSMNLESGTL